MNDLRTLVPKCYDVFFGRFDRLTDVQRFAVPEVMSGRDLLIAAQTASGKTEAFAGPGAEIALDAGRHRQSVLVVSPTRALANDLARRLESRFAGIDLPFGRYTGEHKETKGGGLPAFVVTTLEALDSLIARRPQALRTTRLVVLDEIHVVDGTPRGDQLRVLLHRLERVAERRPQRMAVSATIDDLEEVAGRYLENAAIVSVAGTRRLRARTFTGRAPAEMAQHLAFLVKNGIRKVLVFCNRRDQVESLASSLKGSCVFGDAVFPHHGSLSRTVRERTERQFLMAPAAVAVATMTLELGIDIGSVDYVLLASPPPDTASLLQRVGRGARRTDSTRAGYVAEDAGEEIVYRTLSESGVRGRLLGHDYGFRPSVLVQQALAISGSCGSIDARRLRDEVSERIWHEASLTPEELLETMAEGDLLESARSGRYVLSESTERRYDRGELHSNFKSEPGAEVVERVTGDVIGRLLSEDRRLQLGGGARKVVHARGNRVFVDSVGRATPPKFAPRGAPRCSLRQGRAVVSRLGVADDEIAQVHHGGSTIVLHGLGAFGALVLTHMVATQHDEQSIEKGSPYVLVLSRELPQFTPPSREELLSLVDDRERSLARLCGMGSWHKYLPESTRARATAKCAGLDGLVDLLRKVKLTPPREFPKEVIGAAVRL